MKQNSLFAIFRFTLLEVLRTRLWLFALLIIGLAGAVALFSSSLAITESNDYRIISFATIVRLLAVFIVCLFISNSVIRDFDDGVFDLIVSRPVSRASWYIAKIGAFFTVVGVFSIFCALPLYLFAAEHLHLWWTGLLLELLIVAAAAMAFAITLKNSTIAATAVLGFYVLSRIMSALVLMSARAATEIAQPVNTIVAEVIKGISYLLPDLSRFADSSLLIGTAEISTASQLGGAIYLIYPLVQGSIYCLLLSAVGLFDLYRRNL